MRRPYETGPPDISSSPCYIFTPAIRVVSIEGELAPAMISKVVVSSVDDHLAPADRQQFNTTATGSVAIGIIFIATATGECWGFRVEVEWCIVVVFTAIAVECCIVVAVHWNRV